MDRKDFEEILALKKAFEDDPSHPLNFVLNGYLNYMMETGREKLVKSFSQERRIN